MRKQPRTELRFTQGFLEKSLSVLYREALDRYLPILDLHGDLPVAMPLEKAVQRSGCSGQATRRGYDRDSRVSDILGIAGELDLNALLLEFVHELITNRPAVSRVDVDLEALRVPLTASQVE